MDCPGELRISCLADCFSRIARPSPLSASLRRPDVMVYGAIEMVDSDDGFARVRSRTGQRLGRAIAQGLVRPLLVIMPKSDLNGLAQGILAVEDELAEDEMFEGLDEPLDVAILPRLSTRREPHVQSGVGKHLPEMFGEYRVMIHLDRRSFCQLQESDLGHGQIACALRHPRLGRMLGDASQDGLTGLSVNGQQDVEAADATGIDDDRLCKVDGDIGRRLDRHLQVVVPTSPSIGCWRDAVATQDIADSPSVEVVAQRQAMPLTLCGVTQL